MKFKTVFFIVLYSLFFLFYPGGSYYVNLFSFNRALLADEKPVIDWKISPVPYLIDPARVPETSARGLYVVDMDSFTPVLEKNAHVKYSPASTTKIVTALVAYDVFNLDQVLTVKRALSEGQLMGLIYGEKITAENLLYGILVHSGNDAAYALADNYRFGVDGFVELMNKKAASLHLKDSQFKNPAGFDSFGQYSTPYDLALAGRALLSNKSLAKMVSTKSITIADVDFKYFHTLNNVNKLLGEIQGVGGLKTGYTIDAGENLLTFYKKDDHQYLIVVLNSEDRFKDTTNIVNWLNTNVAHATVSTP